MIALTCIEQIEPKNQISLTKLTTQMKKMPGRCSNKEEIFFLGQQQIWKQSILNYKGIDVDNKPNGLNTTEMQAYSILNIEKCSLRQRYKEAYAEKTAIPCSSDNSANTLSTRSCNQQLRK